MELKDYRAALDALDGELTELLARRMALSGEIGEYKKARGRPILDADREEKKLDAVEKRCPEAFRGEMRVVFRAILEQSRELQQRRSSAMRCGLLGRKLVHSYSPQIHGKLADYGYELFEREPEELEDFVPEGAWQGLNVTIPYKKAVLPFCDALSDSAREIGSVNTLLRRADGSIYGDNTDAFGFAWLLEHSGIDPKGKKALVLGSGGASVMACWVLRQRGARELTVISRSGENNYENLDRHADAELIVNTTPVGMYPNNGWGSPGREAWVCWWPRPSAAARSSPARRSRTAASRRSAGSSPGRWRIWSSSACPAAAKARSPRCWEDA